MISLVLLLYEDVHTSEMSNGLLMRPTLRSLSKSPMHQVYVDGKVLQPKNWISARLNVCLDIVPDTGVHVVGPGQDQDAWFLVLRAPG